MPVIITLATAVIATIIASAILALPVMFLWNWFVPDVFGLTTITWMQSWQLSLLCGILFKGHNSQTIKKAD